MQWQQPIPRDYLTTPASVLAARVAAHKAALGSRLVILGHHYQQDEVIQFADVVGDSFQLSRDAAQQTAAEFVIFCGVHFMAESADVLTGPHQKVILPDLGAGCSMADMAQVDDVEDAWEALTRVCGPEVTLLPVTYMNSSAANKAFVGRHGGAVCTSSNCAKILVWALDGADPDAPITRKIIFFPDQHLGRNTAYQMGFPLEQMVVWDYRQPNGGLTPAQIADARFILWKGHCSVHQLFRPEHVDQARAQYPGVTVIVHPECCWEVVQKADLSGSTDLIGKTIAAAPAGSVWAVGTEVHMVNRLMAKYPDKKIVVLSECQCLCTTMYRIDLAHLAWVLDQLVAGVVPNQISVEPYTAYWARLALQRMLDITAGQPVSQPVDPPPAPPARGGLRVLAGA
ncbi:MAG: quinolinate synthase NadA [Phycisphaerae bacterium]